MDSEQQLCPGLLCVETFTEMTESHSGKERGGGPAALFYLPRELTVFSITAVYIPPDANVDLAQSWTQSWSLFESQDLEEFIVTVLSYIFYCTEIVTITKRIRVFPNQKPWMSSEVRHLIRDCNASFGSGDWAWYSTSRGK